MPFCSFRHRPFLRRLCMLGACTLLLAFASWSWGYPPSRADVFFPNPQGFVTLKCDFHIHTVFSDGNVWPTVRVDEAWRDGLDAIAITDHMEYLPHKNDIVTTGARSYEIAKGTAEALGILLVKAAEITRAEPPGHLNALFIQDIPAINLATPQEAAEAAAKQGAFLFWNHPGWKQPERKAVWYKEQGEYLEKGWLKGLEIVNGPDYEPIVYGWAIEKHLTLLGDSDVHGLIADDYSGEDNRRPMTLVFAKEKTLDALKEALLEGRTAVYSKNQLFGAKQWLEPLFHGSISITTPNQKIKGKGRILAQIRNQSAINFELKRKGAAEEVSGPAILRLPSGKTVLFEARATSDKLSGEKTVTLPYTVTNLFPAPGENLTIEIKLPIVFISPAP
ncbi:MAG: Sb-PDE family phosphodiesterase [Candidatus Sumerlaeota bacterium]|nr:Sb-PDE family phosphodiesterase [Candidatus Sumerlaeota bacterium]